MIVQVNVENMIANNLTTTEYVLLELLRLRKDNYIKRYIAIDSKAKKAIYSLKSLGYILKIDKNGYTIDQKKCSRLLDMDESNFWELFSTYPIKVISGNEMRILRVADPDSQGAKKLLKKYESKVKTKSKHQRILACLNLELKMRKKDNSLKYMQQLSTWLNQESWEKYESFLDQVGTLNLTNNEIHGGKLV